MSHITLYHILLMKTKKNGNFSNKNKQNIYNLQFKITIYTKINIIRKNRLHYRNTVAVCLKK